MRVVVVGHNQVVIHNRARWKYLAELYPDTQVTVIAPRHWRNIAYGKPVDFYVEPETQGNYEVRPLAISSPGSFRHVYRSLDLCLRELQPDIIWIYMDPQAPLMMQTILYRNLYAPHAKIVCCTSTNIPTPMQRFDMRWRYRFALRNLAAFSTGTQEVIDRLRSEGVTLPIFHKVVTGANQDHWYPGEEPKLKADLGLGDFVVGFVGRHEAAKGILDLVAALEGLEGPWSFLSLGEGPLKAEVEQRLKSVPNQGVHLCGYVPHEQTPPYYRCMDALVLFSRHEGGAREPAGVVIMEANLCRVVAVASDLPGPAEIAGETGFVVPEGDVSALRDCLRKLRDDPELRQTSAEEAYQRALRLFSTTAIAQDTYQFFRTLLGEPPCAS